MEWLASNMGTIVVSLVLAAIVIWDIRKLISDRKKGKPQSHRKGSKV